MILKKMYDEKYLTPTRISQIVRKIAGKEISSWGFSRDLYCKAELEDYEPEITVALAMALDSEERVEHIDIFPDEMIIHLKSDNAIQKAMQTDDEILAKALSSVVMNRPLFDELNIDSHIKIEEGIIFLEAGVLSEEKYIEFRQIMEKEDIVPMSGDYVPFKEYEFKKF